MTVNNPSTSNRMFNDTPKFQIHIHVHNQHQSPFFKYSFRNSPHNATS